MSTTPYPPLLLKPIVVPRVWGGTRIADEIHVDLETHSQPVGETWEVSDVGDDPALHSRVADGEYAGVHLRQLIAKDPLGMLGKLGKLDGHRLPLLYKFLDAREPLSVQVHPSDDIVARYGLDGAGKTEAWLILDATEDAFVIYGLEAGLSYSDYLARAREGRGAEGLARCSVTRGDVVYLPAGTLHAIGGGILLAEIQQSSDSTYRIYDWDRTGLDGKPRTLHLEDAAHCKPPNPAPPCPLPAPDAEGTAWRRRLSGAPFQIREQQGAFSGAPPGTISPPNGAQTFAIFSLLAGQGEMRYGRSAVLSLTRGDTVFVPARCDELQIQLADDAWSLWMSPDEPGPHC